MEKGSKDSKAYTYCETNKKTQQGLNTHDNTDVAKRRSASIPRMTLKSCRVFVDWIVYESRLLWSVDVYISGSNVRSSAMATAILTRQFKGRSTHSMPCRYGFRMCLSHLIYTMRPCLIHTCLAMPCSDHSVLLKATAQHIRRETAFGLLPATTRSSTKVYIRSIPISDAGDQCETKYCLSWTRKRLIAAHYKKRGPVKLLD